MDVTVTAPLETGPGHQRLVVAYTLKQGIEKQPDILNAQKNATGSATSSPLGNRPSGGIFIDTNTSNGGVGSKATNYANSNGGVGGGGNNSATGNYVSLEKIYMYIYGFLQFFVKNTVMLEKNVLWVF